MGWGCGRVDARCQADFVAVTGLVAITRDLMDRSRILAAVPDATVVRDLQAQELADAAVIVLDLAAGIAPGDAVKIGPPVVAYGAHVDSQALQAAVEAGCVEAVARSRIFRRVNRLLDEHRGLNEH